MLSLQAQTTDTDGDGIPDITDVDDDNDGILDIEECPVNACTTTSNLVVNGGFESGATGYTVGAGYGSTLTRIYTGYPRMNSCVGGANNSLMWIDSRLTPDYAWQQTLTLSANTNYQFKFKTADARSSPYAVLVPRLVDASNVVVKTFDTIRTFSIFKLDEYKFTFNSGSYTSLKLQFIVYTTDLLNNDILLDDIMVTPYPTCDYDGDGIPNYLDLDSDNDGCSDAFEAGSTLNPQDSIISGPYGTNGLANSLEKKIDSTSINYMLYYSNAISTAIKKCADYDKDGILDVVDIDDDNDGVKDADESSACFYSSNTWLSGNRSSIGVYTEHSNNSYLNFNKLLDSVNSNSGLSYAVDFFNISFIQQTTIYGFDFTFPVELSKIYVGYVSTLTHFNVGTFLKLQGSNDFKTWTNLSDSLAYSNTISTNGVTSISGVGSVNANVFTVTKNSGKYRYYRIYWTNGGGTLSAGVSNEIYFETPSNFQASEYPKYTCTSDYDNDGKLNHQDLDSDNDGCYDAFEGASTTSTTDSTIAAPYGTNGLANSKETATDNGVINYTLTYANAINSSIKNCLDTDKDGIPDNIDIDDDNDGILDVVECDINSKIDNTPAIFNTLAFKNWKYTDFSEASNTNYAGITFGNLRTECTENVYGELKLPSSNLSTSGGALSLPVTSLSYPSMDSGSVIYRELFVKIPNTSTFTSANQISFRVNCITNGVWSSAFLYVAHNGVSLLQTAPVQGGGGNSNILLTTNTQDMKLVSQSKFTLTPEAYMGGEFIVSPQNAGSWFRLGLLILDGQQNEAATVEYKVGSTGGWSTLSTSSGFQFSSTGFYDNNFGFNSGCDFDGDGIPNYLDLDSDNDGCYDAFEGGSTTVYTDSIIAGPYGTNGLANSKETASDNGVINYTLTYASAISTSIANCRVPDISVNSGIVGNVLTLCQSTGATRTLAAGLVPSNNGGKLRWYTVATGGVADTIAPVISRTNPLTVSYWVSQVVASVESPRVEIKVVVQAPPAQPAAISGPTSVNPNTSYTYSIAAVTGATSYIWTLPSGWSGTSSKDSITVTTSSNVNGTITVAAKKDSCAGTAQTLVINSVLNPTTIYPGDSVVYCQGATATALSANLNPSTNGGVLNWYTSATGGTASSTPPTPSTSTSGTTYYYVSQTVNGIESGRTPIKVVINPTPAQPGTITGPTYMVANFNATYSIAAVSGATSYSWTLPNGWTGTSTTNSISINSNSTTSGTISVKAIIGTCNSSSQSLLIQTLPNPTTNYPGDSISYCQNATSSALSANLNPSNNGGTLNWYTTASGGSASSSAPTPSTSSVGTTYYYVSQTVGGIESGRTAIKVIVKALPSQPGAISGTTSVSTNTNYTYSIAVVSGATSYVWTLPSGWSGSSTTTSISINTNSTTSGTIQVASVSNGCTSAYQSLIINTQILNPTSIYPGDSIVYCQGASASALGANLNPSNNGGTLNWYTTPTGGTASSTAPTPSTTFATIQYYYVSQTVNGNESGRTQIRVIVNPTPNQPNSIQGTNAVSANTSYTYSVGAVSGATSYTWTLPNGWSGTSTTNSINVNTGNNTNGIISVVANYGTCSSISQNLVVGTFTTNPTTNYAGDSVVYCQGATASQLVASLNPSNNGGTLNWYTTPTGGTSTSVAPIPNTTFASTYYYYVSQTVNGSESGRTPIKVVVNPVPNQPNAIVGATSVSTSTNYTYSVSAVSGATSYVWTLPNGWTGSSTTNSITINTNSTTSGTVTVVAKIGNCQSTPQTINISSLILNPTTNYLGDSVVYCQGATTSPLSADLNPSNNGGILNWYTTPTGGTSSTSAPTPSSIFAGTFYYYVSQTVNGTESGRTPIKVIIKPVPNQPNAITGPTSVALNGTYTYSILSVPSATSYTWALPNGWSGTSTTTSISINTNSTASGTISVTANINGCSSSAQTLNVGAIPANPTTNYTGDSIVYCQNATASALSANLVPSNNGGTLNWYTTATGGVASSVPYTPMTSMAGTYYYYVSQTVGGVESGRTMIKVVVKSSPAQPGTITGSTSVATNTSYSYSIAAVSGATSYIWTLPNGWTGTSTSTSISINTNSITSGIISVQAVQSSCSSIAQTLKIGSLPLNPTTNYAGDSVVYCQSATAAALSANLVPSNNGGTLNWYTVPVGGTSTSIAPTPSTSYAGIYYYYVSQTVNGIESGRTTIKVVVNPTPNQPNTIAGSIEVAANSTQTYSISAVPNATSYIWTLPSGWSGASTSNSISVNVANVSGTISVAAVINGCTGNSQSLNVSIKTPIPDISINPNIVGNVITYCQGATANALTAQISSNGILRWYDSDASTLLSSAPTPSTSISQIKSYYVSQVINGVESNKVEIKVVVNPIPNQPNTIQGNSTVTAGVNQTYSVTAVPGATSYTWTLPNGWTGSSTTNTITTTTGSTGGTIYVKANLNNCSSLDQTLNVNILNSVPDISVNPNIVGNTITYCQNTVANALVAQTTVSGATLIWYATATGGNALSAPITPSTSTLGTTSYFVAQVVNGTESARVEIKVVITNQNCASNTCNLSEPILSMGQIFNNCPSTTADLSQITTSNQPLGAILEWHTSIPATLNNKVLNPNAVTAGVYYAVFYNVALNCYASNGTKATPVIVAITSCTNCNAGFSAPILSSSGVSNICPANTADLTKITASNQPSGAVLEWHTALPISNYNKVNNPSAVAAGTYYAVFYDATNNCYSNYGYAYTPVIANVNSCPNPCLAGSTAPVFTPNWLVNVCPSNTANLNAVVVNNLPNGTVLEWHTSIPATSVNKVTNQSSVLSGTYYAVFYDAINNCYGANGYAEKPIQVVINNCSSPCNSGNDAPILTMDSTSNICPNTTADLYRIKALNTPINTVLEWHTSLPATTSNRVTDISAVNAGTYYAVFYDSYNKCYAAQGYAAKQFVVSITNCAPSCIAGNVSPSIAIKALANNCPSNSVDLTAISVFNIPRNCVVEWHTALPATPSNKILNPQSYAVQSVVYAVFYDPKNNCYNQNGSYGTPVQIVITTCPNPCKGGSQDPTLTKTDISNVCPNSLSSLIGITASNLPAGTKLEWHTALPTTTSNKLTNLGYVSDGIYYAVFYDSVNNCYSMNGLSGTQVIISNAPCPKCLVPSAAPEISNTTVASICPSTTVNLNTIPVNNKPKGVIVKWYTNASTLSYYSVSNPSAVSEGIYYATFFDTANNCYSANGISLFTPVTVTITKCCNAGNEGPSFVVNTLTNICPSFSVDLSNFKVTNQPSNLVLEFHTGTPATSANKVNNYSSVAAGTYYAVFYDPVNNCYSDNGVHTTPVTVSIVNCTTCHAGNNSPSLSTLGITNKCPSKTADLSQIQVYNQPRGTVLEWHSALPINKGNQIYDLSTVTSGTYYAIFYDPTDLCYAGGGLAYTSIIVSNTSCSINCNAGVTAPTLPVEYVSNNCPATTVNLNILTPTAVPTGSRLEWHTSYPATPQNYIVDPSAMTAGTYYGVYYDLNNNCYSGNGYGVKPINVLITGCTDPCDTFKTAPTLLKDTALNSCPATTVNLTDLVGAIPNGKVMYWHTELPASNTNRLSNLNVDAGTYYPVLYDTINNCYSMKGYSNAKAVITISNCPICFAGNEAPVPNKKSLVNECPNTLVDLTTLKIYNIPRNTIVTYHSSTPASLGNRISNPSTVTMSGTYYLCFYDFTNNCYAGGGNATTPVQVEIINCNNVCSTGTASPLLGSTTIKNICPSLYADLSSVASFNKPNDVKVVLSWHTSTPATIFNKIQNINSVGAGTYYAIFYDTLNKCFAGNGKSTEMVIVSIDNCNPKCNAGNYQPYFGKDTLKNSCPSNLVNLNNLYAMNQPKGTVIEWRDVNNNVILNPTNITSSGLYYAYFKDTLNNCFSTGTPNPIRVVLNVCVNPLVNNDYTSLNSRNGNSKNINISLNDTKPSGSKYKIATGGNPKKGTATIDPVTGNLNYVLTDTSFVGYDTVVYELCDTITNRCVSAYVIISISHPKDTSVINDSENNAPLEIDSKNIKGLPDKPNGASQRYDIVVSPNSGTASIDSNGKVIYTKNANACGKDSIKVSKTYTFANGRPSETYSYWIYIYNNCNGDDIIPNFISANGDGINDYFVLPDSYLRKYPNLKLVVYNRWGNIVWRSVGPYKNNWNGIHYDNNVLPDGVYYYVIELQENFSDIKTGFVQILRD